MKKNYVVKTHHRALTEASNAVLTSLTTHGTLQTHPDEEDVMA